MCLCVLICWGGGVPINTFPHSVINESSLFMCPAQIINSKVTLHKTKAILYKELMTTWKIDRRPRDRHSGAIRVNGEGGQI